MVQFIFPEIRWNKRNPPIKGVYKMIFDTGKFYIGSSGNLKQRFSEWKTKLQSGVNKNYLITQQFEICKSVTFEVIEIVTTIDTPKIREDFYIKKNWGNELLLNRSSSAFLNIHKRTESQKEKRKIAMRSSGITQKVAQYDKGGNLIKIHSSVIDAAESVNGYSAGIRLCFKEYGVAYKGFVFKKVTNFGEIIEPPVVIKTYRKSGKKKGHKLSEEVRMSFCIKRQMFKQRADYTPPKLPTHSKEVNQYNLNGELVNTYPSIREAARKINTEYKNFKRFIKNNANGVHKGYVFQYA